MDHLLESGSVGIQDEPFALHHKPCIPVWSPQSLCQFKNIQLIKLFRNNDDFTILVMCSFHQTFLPVYWRMCNVMVYKLSPLHHHQRVSNVRCAHIIVNIHRNKTRTWKRGACDGSTSRAHEPIIISWC